MDYQELNLAECKIIGVKLFQNYKVVELWTPWMKISDEVICSTVENNNKKYEFLCSFIDENNERLSEFYKLIGDIDKFIKRKNKTADYYSIMRKSKLLSRANYDKKEKNILTEFKYENGDSASIFDIRKGMYMRALIRFDRIWKMGMSSGCILTIQEAEIKNNIENES